RPLAAGDAIPLGAGMADAGRAGTRAAPPLYGGPLRAMRGPHGERFQGEAFAEFFAADFTVRADSDRMGVRLEGAPIAGEGDEILTCGLVAGAIQIPRGGAPIVMLADHQTTGGYPVIATVIAADVGRAAQLVPGERVRFVEVDREEAVAALRETLRPMAEVA
ncbi:MAG: urea amidolyase, partial [Chloroflexota bacterium]|nr:urea amidolyase [Chloroflexota bacterium]